MVKRTDLGNVTAGRWFQLVKFYLKDILNGWTFVNSSLFNPYSFFPKVLDRSNHKGNKNIKTRYLFLIINCIACLQSFICNGNFDNYFLYQCDTISIFYSCLYFLTTDILKIPTLFNIDCWANRQCHLVKFVAFWSMHWMDE